MLCKRILFACCMSDALVWIMEGFEWNFEATMEVCVSRVYVTISVLFVHNDFG